MKPQRERFWGLYDYDGKEWDRHRSREGLGDRVRYKSFAEAAKAMIGGDVPRPFYVVRKPRALPPEVQAVVEAAKAYTVAVGRPTLYGHDEVYTQLYKAVANYIYGKCGISFSS